MFVEVGKNKAGCFVYNTGLSPGFDSTVWWDGLGTEVEVQRHVTMLNCFIDANSHWFHVWEGLLGVDKLDVKEPGDLKMMSGTNRQWSKDKQDSRNLYYR